MSKVRDLHNDAMQLAQEAVVMRHSGQVADAERLAKEAMALEAEAANRIKRDAASEPTRSILYRSAASLALQARDFDEAERLIAGGLAGYPPPEIRAELKELNEQLTFERYLNMSGLQLGNDQMMLTLLGKAVMGGHILYDEFMKRLEALKQLFDRTQARKMKSPYGRGKVAKKDTPFSLILAEGQSRSYSMTLKLAIPTEERMVQQGLFVPKPAEVISDVVTGLELINALDDEKLKKRISDKGYYTNFRTHSKALAPDGEQISFVGLSTAEKTISLTTPRKNIKISEVLTATKESQYIDVIGVLDYAESKKKDIIGLTDEKGSEYLIKVEEGMDDLVRNHFKQKVQVTGLLEGKYITPSDIEGVED